MSPKKILKFAVGPVGLGLLGFVSVPLVSWFFTPEDLGVFAMLQVAQGVGLMLFSLGLDQAYAREFHQASNRAALFLRCAGPGFGLVLAFFLAAGVYGFEKFAALVYGVSDFSLGLITWLGLFFGYAVRYIALLLRMNERALQFSFTQLFPKAVFLLIVLSIAVLEMPRSYLDLSGAHVAGFAAAALLFSYITKPLWSFSVWTVDQQAAYGRLFQYALPLVITGVAAWGLKAVDKVSLRALSTLAELGIYSVAVTVAGGVAILTSVFNTIWAPIVYKMAADGTAKDDLLFAGRVIEFLVFLLFVVTGLFSWIIVYLVPAQYSEVDVLLPLCVFAPLIYSLSEAMTIGINLARKTGYALLATLISLAFGALLNFISVPYFGAVGAGISTAAAFYVYLVLRFEFSRVVWKKQPRLRLYSMVFICLIVAAFNALIEGVVGYKAEFSWLVIGGFGVLFYKNELRFVGGKIRTLRAGGGK